MGKLDLKKSMGTLYAPKPKVVVEVVVPAMQFLMIDGQGDPNTSLAYAAAVEALFSLSYAIKFMVKKGPMALDYGVMPLEGLWSVDDMAQFDVQRKADWRWTMMIMQPDVVTPALMTQAMEGVLSRRNNPALTTLRLERFDEGHCAQTLHVGPFATEGPNVALLHQHVAAHGQLRGKHHEIYLSDIRKADPSRWRTILRQPMA
jgi:hypothetical protein